MTSSILKMDARERDALIAQHLFNRRIADTAQAAKDGCDGTPPYEWHMAGIYGPARVEAPHYSTDVKADYSVLCHVREKWDINGLYEFSAALGEIWWKRTKEMPVGEKMRECGVQHLMYQPGDYSIAALAALK